MSIPQLIGKIVCGAVVVGVCWEVTIRNWIKWEYTECRWLADQLRVCKQFPAPDQRGDVYYKGMDLTQTEAREALQRHEAKVKALQCVSLISRLTTE
jgi:hypothetical protein